MHPGLAQGIIDGDDWVKTVFTEQFLTVKQWRDFMLDHFGGHLKVEQILDRSSGWSATQFQALYVACWIFFPVEKGSFMIQLTPAQRANVRAGYDKLGARWTSHLHKHGRSASNGWSFLKGYHELLVQMEGGGKNTSEVEPHLFLKCEGHTAFTASHLVSYFQKKKTGKGAVANAALRELARHQQERGLDHDLGITERAAENYSNGYKALLKQMGYAGKVTTVHEAASGMYINCMTAMREQPTLQPSLDSLAASHGLTAPMSEKGVGDLNNADLGKLIEKVILPFCRGVGMNPAASASTKAFAGAVVEAEPDLKVIAKQLATDAANTGRERSLRYFQEIVLSPAAINAGLDAAYKLLSGPRSS